MKTTIMAGTAALLLSLAGCSSTPSDRSTVSVDRENFVESVNNRIEKLNDRAAKMTVARRADLKASLEDVRTELRALTSAPESNWSTYRVRVEDRMARVQSRFGVAE